MRRVVLRVTLYTAGCLLLCGAAVAAVDYSDFSRYEIILSRQPFGEPPPEPQPKPNLAQDLKPPVPPPDSFIKGLRMCGISRSDEGLIRVAIVDIKSKPERSYSLMLGAGPNQDGVELVKAEYEEQAALLRKGEEEEWVYMGGKSGGAPGGKTTAIASAPRAPVPAVSGSYLERLKKRRAALRVKEVRRPSLSGDDLKSALSEYQMELIRARGELGPPLPIPLTREMDDTLVSEGVLPPLEEEPAE